MRLFAVSLVSLSTLLTLSLAAPITQSGLLSLRSSLPIPKIPAQPQPQGLRPPPDWKREPEPAPGPEDQNGRREPAPPHAYWKKDASPHVVHLREPAPGSPGDQDWKREPEPVAGSPSDQDWKREPGSQGNQNWKREPGPPNVNWREPEANPGSPGNQNWRREPEPAPGPPNVNW